MGSHLLLSEILQQKSPHNFTRYKYIKETASSGFQKYATMIGYLTDHGTQHYANIESNLALLLPDDVKRELAVEELFLLLCAVHFHDIGLLSEKYPDEPWEDTRKEHVDRTYDYLDEYYADWGFNRFEAYALKNICLGHGGNKLYNLPQTQVLHRATVRIQFLAALLRIADELDLDYTRVSKYMYTLKKMPKDSLKHWIKHEEISGVYINSRSWTIQIHAMPETSESKAIIQDMVVEKVQKELDYVRPFFEENNLYYRQVQVSYIDFGEKRVMGSPQPITSQLDSISAPPSNRKQKAYIPFDLLIDEIQADGSCSIRVIASPCGEAIAKIHPATELKDVQIGLTDNTLKSIGNQLFSTLFKESIKDRFSESIGKLDERECLRIRLRIMSPELRRVPWEALYDKDKRSFLALSSRLSLLRYVHTAQPAKSMHIPTPIKMLVAIASPKNLPTLNIATEEKNIRQSLSSLTEAGYLQLDILQSTTKNKLRQHLLQEYHIVHFIGHGGFSDSGGHLALENPTTGKSDLVDAETLSVLMRDTLIKLVFLNACKTAESSSQDIFAGLAHALVNAGIPAVVAMQFPVKDSAAIIFATDFYTRLVEARPLDECITKARQAIMLQTGLNSLDWVCPVLFTRASDAMLFKT